VFPSCGWGLPMRCSCVGSVGRSDLYVFFVPLELVEVLRVPLLLVC
jgi:hypothetical protein